MKFIGVLFCAGLICAASAKLPMAKRKYKFYLNRFSHFRSFHGALRWLRHSFGVGRTTAGFMVVNFGSEIEPFIDLFSFS